MIERRASAGASAYVRCATPGLNEDARQHQCFRVFEVALQKGRQLVQFGFSDQLLIEDPGPRVLYEIKQQHATPMIHRVCVYPRLHANIHQPGFTHQTRHLRADRPVNPVHFGPKC